MKNSDLIANQGVKGAELPCGVWGGAPQHRSTSKGVFGGVEGVVKGAKAGLCFGHPKGTGRGGGGGCVVQEQKLACVLGEISGTMRG